MTENEINQKGHQLVIEQRDAFRKAANAINKEFREKGGTYPDGKAWDRALRDHGYDEKSYDRQFKQLEKEAHKMGLAFSWATGTTSGTLAAQRAQEAKDEEAAKAYREKEKKEKEENERRAKEAREAQKAKEKAEREERQKKEKEEEAAARAKRKAERKAHRAEVKADWQREKVAIKNQRKENVKAAGNQGVADSAAALKDSNDFLKKQMDVKYDDKTTSKQVLSDMKSTWKGLGKFTFGNGISEVKGAAAYTKTMFNDSSKDAHQTIQDMVDGKTIFRIGDMSKAGMAGLAAQQISDANMLALQKSILGDRMTEATVIQMIANQVTGKDHKLQSFAGNVTTMYLSQKAYIHAYIKNTFGNEEFMKNINSVVTKQLDAYIDALSQEQIDKYSKKLDQKVDKIFTRGLDKVDAVTGKINHALDKMSKIDICKSLSNMVDKATSFDSLEKKLNKTVVGRALAPGIMTVLNAGSLAVQTQFASSKFMTVMKGVQGKIKGIQDKLTKAKDKIKQKTQQLKNYVNDLKKKAQEAVKKYATKIIGDIKSKITVAAGNMLKGVAKGALKL